MKVRDVASSAVVAVGPAQSLREATQLMAKHRVGSAVVQDAEMLVGILTERDFLTKVAGTAGFGSRPVAAYMTRDPETVAPGDPL
ncbi:MAG TPA: CBS domain-containing protein, partial [Actinomycetes bacterium]|nr:CBS domain-containing protein [Actinomycetes bacterium]